MIKRILAILGVVFLAGLYLLTLFAALTASPESATLFKVCIVCTFVVPSVLYIILRLLK